MRLLRPLSGLLTRPTRKRTPGADRVAPVSEYLRGQPGDAVLLPLLPDSGGGTAGIEFAAASILERIVLGALVVREHPRRIFEIGTFRGVTALSMAANCSWDAVLWTLDLPPDLSAAAVNAEYYAGNAASGFQKLADAGTERDVGSALRGYTGRCRVEQLFGDAGSFDFGPYSGVDLFFVDGCHQYEAARRDTLTAWTCLRPGGLLVWHDYTWESVERAARASCRTEITWVERTSLAFTRKP